MSKAKGIETFTISIYGPTDCGVGHITDGRVPGPRDRVSTSGGASDFDRMLAKFVCRNKLRTGTRIVVTIEAEVVK